MLAGASSACFLVFCHFIPSRNFLCLDPTSNSDLSRPVTSYFLVLIAKLCMTISFLGHALAECWIFCLFPSRVLNRRNPPGLTFPQPLFAFELFTSWKSSWQPLIFYSRKRPWPITSSHYPWCGIS